MSKESRWVIIPKDEYYRLKEIDASVDLLQILLLAGEDPGQALKDAFRKKHLLVCE